MENRKTKKKAGFIQGQKKPDCYSITDDQLKEAINGNWPALNGVTEIPYGFTYGPFLTDAYYLDSQMSRYISAGANENRVELLRPKVQSILDHWAALSQGALRFTEVTRASIFARGIFFYFADQLLFKEDKISGLAIRRYDNNHKLLRAYVFLPQNDFLWDDVENHPNGLRTINHEIGHALGFDHLHEFPDIQKLLNQTLDGGYCSVMPYLSAITTNISRCLANCLPPFAVDPGPLDERMLSLAYVQGLSTSDVNESLFRGDVFYNTRELMVFSFATAFLHRSLFHAASLLPGSSSGEPLLSQHSALVAADLSLLMGMMCLGVPSPILNYFLATATLKYLPELFPLPQRISSVLSDNEFGLTLFNGSGVYFYGQQMYPSSFALLFSTIGTYVGSRSYSILQHLAELLRQAVSKTKDFREAKQEVQIKTPGFALESKQEEQSASRTEKQEKLSLGSNANSFFYKSQPEARRTSLCTRLRSWFRRKETNKEIEIDNPSKLVLQ